MTKLFPLLMALTAYTMLSLGFVLQKKGIRWMGWKGPKTKTFYRNLTIWITGFIVMNIYGIPSAIALKSLPPHVVSAFAGWGIVMLVFFSFFILKERLYPSDYLYSFLIVTGILVLGYVEPSTSSRSLPTGSSFNRTAMIILYLLPLLIFIAGVWRKFSLKVKTTCFASVSGMTAGLMVVSLRLLVIHLGYDVSRYFTSIYLYLYILAALLSLISLQLALKSGSMIAVGPLQYSNTIIYPLLSTIFVFQQPVHILQYCAAALIVFAVTRILKKH